MNKIKETLGIFGIVLAFIVVVCIASSMTVFTLMEQYQHNYKTCNSNYDKAKVSIGNRYWEYNIKELYEDSKTYKIVDENDVYHIVYKEDCEFYGENN